MLVCMSAHHQQMQAAARANKAWPTLAKRARQVSVCLISAHPAVLAEFEGLLPASEFRVVKRPLEFGYALEATNLTLPPANIFVIDAHAPRPVTEALLANIREGLGSSKVLVLADEFSEDRAFAALRLGAKALLTYSEARERLTDALRAVAIGNYWVPRSLLSRFVDSIVAGPSAKPLSVTRDRLTRREREVLGALLENLSNKEIASRLNISDRTAKFHVANVLAKFGVRRRADLIRLSYQTQ
jgi:DNA-binding NarL/FixJ family response regulator